MHYYSLGNLPKKRHTQFRKEDGSLYSEQLFSTEGFSDNYSLLYHNQPPTQIIQIADPVDVSPNVVLNKQLSHRSLKGFDIAPVGDYLESRKPVLVNNDCKIILAAPMESTEKYFYKNADADEILFIHEGSGTLKTMYGNLPFEYGDYLVIPRGTIYQMEFTTSQNRLFIVESVSAVITPRRYRNEFGQLMEHSPFCERDIRKPQDLHAIDEKETFALHQKQDQMYPYHYKSHPLM